MSRLWATRRPLRGSRLSLKLRIGESTTTTSAPPHNSLLICSRLRPPQPLTAIASLNSPSNATYLNNPHLLEDEPPFPFPKNAILHRDIKPENGTLDFTHDRTKRSKPSIKSWLSSYLTSWSTVLFGSDGVVKLVDFGLGKLADRNQIFTRSNVGVSLSVARKVRVARCRCWLWSLLADWVVSRHLAILLLYVTWLLY
jgi:hypothetical protein